jgi:streptogramin lyase
MKHRHTFFSASLKSLALLGFCCAAWLTLPLSPALAADPVVEVVVGTTEPAPGADLHPGVLNAPFAVCFEPNGDMWIVEFDGGRLLRRTVEGKLVHVAGDGTQGYADGTALSAQFNKLHNVTRLNDGRLLMSDHENHAIRCYDPKSGLISSYSGNGSAGFFGDNGPVMAATYNEPICVEVTPDNQSVLVADIRNLRLRKIDLRTQQVQTIAGNGQRGKPIDGQLAIDSPLLDPRAAIADSQGNIFFIERSGNSLRQIDPQGRIHTIAGSGSAGHVDGAALQATMRGPKHLCLGPDDSIFIADDNNNAVRKFDPTTQQLTTVNWGPYQLLRPHGVAVNDGWLYVADSYHHRILRVKL